MTDEELKKKRADLTLTITTAGHGLGSAFGLYLAYKGKKKFWGYVGRGLLFGIIAGAVSYPIGYGISLASIKKANDENETDTED